MTAPVFLVDQMPESDRIELDGPEGHHAATVRRLTPGEVVQLGDGVGGVADCEVAEVGPGRVVLTVVRRRQVPQPEPRVTVVQALPKGERGELAVELMTEAGVDEIVPWQAARCVAQWKGERGQKARTRWQATAREASKQSRRSRVPVIAGLHHLPDVCRLVSAADVAYVLHERAMRALARAGFPLAGQLVLIVGPEGGLTDGETLALRAAGAEPVRLGPEVLRTSTAGMAALSVVSARTTRWG